MSHTNFEEILSKFKEQFPPAKDLPGTHLRLTTQQIRVMITDLDGMALDDSESLFDCLKSNGYVYHPVEENERVVFYWLIKALEN